MTRIHRKRVSFIKGIKKMSRARIEWSIRSRFFLAMFLVAAIAMLVGLTVSLHESEVFRTKCTDDYVQRLEFTSYQMNTAINSIEALTLRIFGNEKLQTYLYEGDGASGYLRAQLNKKALQTVTDIASEVSCITCSGILTKENTLLYQGTKGTLPFTSEESAQLRAMAEEKNGKSVYKIIRDRQGAMLVFLRQIRRTENVELTNLGTLFLCVDANRLVHSIGIDKAYSQYANIAIQKDDQLLYTDHETLSSIPEAIDNYIKIDGKSYFCIERTDGRTEWRYALFAPESELFGEYIHLAYKMVFYFSLVFVGIILLSVAFSSSLVKPIYRLAERMKEVEAGDFSTQPDLVDLKKQRDEIAELSRCFEIMLQKIDTMVIENLKKEAAIKDARYRALQAQINPHFLYNTLDSVYWLSKSGKCEEIGRIISALGHLLRTSITGNALLVPLETEIMTLQKYITIQKIRYGRRLQVRIDNELPLNTDWMVPSLILQPLVENSIRHGLEIDQGTCTILVQLKRRSKQLHIVVSDNGPGISPQQIRRIEDRQIEATNSGIGLKSIQERLDIMFHKRYQLIVRSQLGEGTEVSIILDKDLAAINSNEESAKEEME